MSSGFLDKRFVIVAGKGGVGKSTMCAALGLMAARAGKRTIIAELNTREKAPHFFGKPDSGYDAQEIWENLYSINIQPEPALHEYGLMKLKFERVFKLVFENEAMQRLLRMVPGMNELILLGKAFNLERERTRRGDPVWDMIIVDAPATGHGVSLLRLPQVVLEVSRTGPMADEVRAMRDLLQDPARTMLNLVSLPEEMPVKETIMLSEQVDSILQIPKGYLLVNGVFPELAGQEERALLGTFEAATAADGRIGRAIACIEAMVGRRDLQQGYLDELARRVALPAIEVPYLFEREFGFDAIDTISRRLADAMT
ncbi:MAG: hypothetical protein EP329_06775 [Deltaproteobacteria bacterium]|nr:MAG: hypothetical protein EP329_06775 [Deltaproteobacteria bacterium]